MLVVTLSSLSSAGTLTLCSAQVLIQYLRSLTPLKEDKAFLSFDALRRSIFASCFYYVLWRYVNTIHWKTFTPGTREKKPYSSLDCAAKFLSISLQRVQDRMRRCSVHFLAMRCLASSWFEWLLFCYKCNNTVCVWIIVMARECGVGNQKRDEAMGTKMSGS